MRQRGRARRDLVAGVPALCGEPLPTSLLVVALVTPVAIEPRTSAESGTDVVRGALVKAPAGIGVEVDRADRRRVCAQSDATSRGPARPSACRRRS
jgi:hypothetical protein